MSNKNTPTTSATAKALVAVSGPIPDAKRGRPVGSGHVWPALIEQVMANPGQTFQAPTPVNAGIAPYLRKRYGVTVATRASDTPKLVNLYLSMPKPAKAARKPRTQGPVATVEIPTVQA